MSDEGFKWNTKTGNDKSFTLEWPDSMRGREITVYIYRYYELPKLQKIREYAGTLESAKDYSIFEQDGKYHFSNFMEFTSHPFKQFGLTKGDEEDLFVLRRWVMEMEEILSREKVTPNGCANGDLPLGGKYASFR